MKSILLLLIAICFSKACFADAALTLTGSTSTCPNTDERYVFYTDNSNTQSLSIHLDGLGYIKEYGKNGAVIQSGTNTQDITISGIESDTYITKGYVIIHWGNFRGSTATIDFSASTPRILTNINPHIYVKVVIGSPDITSITTFNASCDTQNISFSMPIVVGASSYNWQNTLGWSLVQTFDNGGYTYATFSSNGSTRTSGQVTASVVNNGCPSTNSTRTFAVTRTVGDHTVSGPNVVPASQYADYTAPDGSNYNWFVSTANGWSIVSGQGTNHIQVQAPANNNLQLPIGVNYIDVCGQQQTGSILVSTQTYDNSFAGTKQTTEDGKPAKPTIAVQPVVLETAIYPNPVADELTVSSNGKEGKVLIYSSFGALISEIAIKSGNVRTLINIRSLSAGTYQVQLKQNGLPDVNKHISIHH